MTPTILLYSVPADTHRQIEQLAQTIGFSCKKIAKKRFLQSIGCHAGIPGFAQTADWYEGKDLPFPMLVFSGFSSRDLDRFLAACKEKNITGLDYRAVVTEHNMHWSALELFQELMQERESMQAYL